MTGGSIMVNELRKKTSINAYLQVDGLAAFGIAAIAATMYITMIMYPCSGGTDTVSPGL